MTRIIRTIMIVTLAGLLIPAFATADEAPRMATEALKSRLGSAELLVVDMRGSWDWNRSQQKVVGAVRVEPNDAFRWATENARGKTIVLYCA